VSVMRVACIEAEETTWALLVEGTGRPVYGHAIDGRTVRPSRFDLRSWVTLEERRPDRACGFRAKTDDTNLLFAIRPALGAIAPSFFRK